MNNQEKVTVVTVCYNCREDLQKTLISVISQKYTNIEYIIIDGGSTDGSLEIIKAHQSNITKWISEPDNGIYDAMNKGIELATGEWILFMNAGDVFHDDSVLDKIFNRSFSDNTAIIYGDVELDFGNGRKLERKLNNFTQETVISDLCHQGLLTRTSVLKDIKYDTNYWICADLDSFVKINAMGKDFVYVPILIATFEVTDGISSNYPFRSLIERKRIHGYRYLSRIYLKSSIKALIRYTLLKLLPKDFYDYWRYNKVKNISRYK